MLILMFYFLYIWIGLQHILVGFKNYLLFVSIIPSSWTAHIDSLKLTAARPEKKDGAWKRILFVGEKGSHISNSIDN